MEWNGQGAHANYSVFAENPLHTSHTSYDRYENDLIFPTAHADQTSKESTSYGWKDSSLMMPSTKGWPAQSKFRGPLSPRPNTPISKPKVSSGSPRANSTHPNLKAKSVNPDKSAARKNVAPSLHGNPTKSQTSQEARPRKELPEQEHCEDTVPTKNLSAPVASDRGRKPRRKAHNDIERRYRTKLNARIAELRNSVPSLRFCSASETHANNFDDPDDLLGDAASGLRTNKALVLEKATEYIKELENRNQELQAEILAKDRALAAAREIACSPSQLNQPVMTNEVSQASNTGDQPWTSSPPQEYAPWENEPAPWLGQWTLPLSGLFV